MRRPIDRLFEGVVVLLGFALGAQPIRDNSMFVHIRTGIDIVNGDGIPRRDPYSFTAAGTRWVVQSWLPSTVYGAARELGGDGLLLLVQGVLTGTLAYLIFRLAAPAGTTLRALGAALVALATGATLWSPRPLLFGLVCLGLMIVVVTERRAPWLLVPIAWVWVSSHGSFPLGGLWLALVAVGAALDRRRVWTDEARYGLWFVGGLVVACVNPLGPRLLLFPLVVGDHAATFREISEWRSPNFQAGFGPLWLGGIMLVIIIVSRGRLRWGSALPLAAFVGFGLLAVRNLAPLSIVAAAGLGMAMRRTDDEATTSATERLEGASWSAVDRVVCALAIAAAVFVAADAAASPALSLEAYPRAVVTEGERVGVLAPGRRVATSDIVGCYLILRRGRRAHVFVDDRYDMYPVSVSDDYRALLRGEPVSPKVLTRRQIDTVLWERSLPLVQLLIEDGWVEAVGDKRWVVLTRPGTWPS